MRVTNPQADTVWTTDHVEGVAIDSLTHAKIHLSVPQTWATSRIQRVSDGPQIMRYAPRQLSLPRGLLTRLLFWVSPPRMSFAGPTASPTPKSVDDFPAFEVGVLADLGVDWGDSGCVKAGVCAAWSLVKAVARWTTCSQTEAPEAPSQMRATRSTSE